MCRRGPPKSKATIENKRRRLSSGSSSDEKGSPEMTVERVNSTSVVRPPPLNAPQVSFWPFDLDATESLLLDHYIQRFSRTYPTFSGPTNPFLRVILPLALQSRVVLDSLLALGGVQSWSNNSLTMESAMLKLRHKALRGCQELAKELYTNDSKEASANTSAARRGSDSAVQLYTFGKMHDAGSKRLYLLTSCVMLLLYEKLTGDDGENGATHLQFFARVFPEKLFLRAMSLALNSGSSSGSPAEAFQFVTNLFLYNDLVRSTSCRTVGFSDFYPNHMLVDGNDTNDGGKVASRYMRRYFFPALIARMSAGDLSVTDAEVAEWNGDLSWIPSFSLSPQSEHAEYERLPTANQNMILDPSYRSLEDFASTESWTEQQIISELYRIAGTVYRRQCLMEFRSQLMDAETSLIFEDIWSGNLPAWAVQLIKKLPDKSSFESTLLWPIGIIAEELTSDHAEERKVILERLGSLESRFHMKHFKRARDHFEASWSDNAFGRALKFSGIMLG